MAVLNPDAACTDSSLPADAAERTVAPRRPATSPTGRPVTGAPDLGVEIPGYRVESVLGAGGMGIVYLARGPQGGICALKVLPRRLLGDDPTFATRFKREAQYAEALDHPHVVELYEAGEAPDGTLYIAMQYVDGPDLGVLIRRDGAFSLPTALVDPRADRRRAGQCARDGPRAPRREAGEHHRGG